GWHAVRVWRRGVAEAAPAGARGQSGSGRGGSSVDAGGVRGCMRAQDIVRLVVLAAIWGASFLFMRVIADGLGVMTTACSRVLIAGVVLCSWFAMAGIGVEWRKHWRAYAVIGVVNSAV